MTKLATPFGTIYLLKPAEIVSVGPAYASNPKYKVPTRQVTLTGGQNLWISDTEENMRLLVGSDYVPDVLPKVPAKKAKKEKKVDG